ncbi:30S ribosomal protein 2, chloroplastic [Dorcoceras hygrometricum]|uniref:Small ribosomal subunit protein cS22 n=1 Tax=Dorcoceras hygrometricum TaxID=472368 RepID=A0A2Z7ANF7_9LAMI|nr:30S ribosomal protein 2, chloroplastic [Dorcoceras hygrometricum]
MATVASSSSLQFSTFLQNPTKPFKSHLPKLNFQLPRYQFISLKELTRISNPTKLYAVVAQVSTAEPSSEAARRLYVGNIPRTVTTDELRKIVEEHGSVEKAEVMYDKYSGRSRRFAFVTMKSVEEANATVEKLNGTEIRGRTIKVNITEKPMGPSDVSFLQVEDSKFIDSPYKVYVGNLAKSVTTETLKEFFSEKGKVLSAKVSRLPGTSKSSGYGFVTFSSEEDVETAISGLNNTVLEGQKIRVNKA